MNRRVLDTYLKVERSYRLIFLPLWHVCSLHDTKWLWNCVGIRQSELQWEKRSIDYYPNPNYIFPNIFLWFLEYYLQQNLWLKNTELLMQLSNLNTSNKNRIQRHWTCFYEHQSPASVKTFPKFCHETVVSISELLCHLAVSSSIARLVFKFSKTSSQNIIVLCW